MTSVAARPLTFEEFLALPEPEVPTEFVCGKVVEKPMPTIFHMNLVNALGMLIGAYLLRTGLGMLGPEGRFLDRGERRTYLPDMSVILHRDEPESADALVVGPFERPPDLAIEVLSPDDRPVRVADEVTFYLRAGVPLTWVIDPIDETLTAFSQAGPSIPYSRGTIVPGDPVLPGFQLDLEELFTMVETLMRKPRNRN